MSLHSYNQNIKGNFHTLKIGLKEILYKIKVLK